MPSIIPLKFEVRPMCLGLVTLSICIAAGCAAVNNPFKDSGAAVTPEMTTPSANAYLANPEPTLLLLQRKTLQADVIYENGVVTHWPLWFEDPFEDKGNRYRPVEDPDEADAQFAVNWVDFLHVAYGPARLLLNTAAWPISAIVTPPGTLMESDARISKGLVWYDHDARRSEPGNREPPDEALIRFETPAPNTPDQPAANDSGEPSPPVHDEPAPVEN